MRPRLRHRAEYALARTIEGAFGWLSPRMADRLGTALGDVARSPAGVRRSVVEENLRRAFPEADSAWIEEIARASYRHLGREAVAMLRLSRLDAAGVRRAVEIPERTWSAVQEALGEGRGVILATGHYGNWEMAAAAVAARGVPIEAIVQRQSNPLVHARIEAARSALGVETVEMGEASRRIPRALLAGKGVGIVADQDARHSGVWVPFFGVPASSHRGPALFALRLGSPLFASVCRRLPDGRYLLDGSRIDVTRTGSLEEDVARVTAMLASHLEAAVRSDPTQYFWFHKRWKSRPPEEPPSVVPGTTSRGPEEDLGGPDSGAGSEEPTL
jgi:Kdo2-lipid IVA lauroyltransferase/acyltransferase